MKKLIFVLLFTGYYCTMPDIECTPEYPCVIEDVQYISYDPPVDTATQPAMPSQPVVLTKSGNSSAEIVWEVCQYADSYNLYVSTDGVNYVQKSNVVSPHFETGLVNDVNYHIIVSATNASGETMSSDNIVKPGIIDNMDGTITIISQNLTWAKCSQSDLLGNDGYNAISNDCSNSVPARFSYCDTRYGCVDSLGLQLNGTGASEVFNTCAAKGPGWRVAKRDELLSFNRYYSASLWPDVVNDWYYPNEGWNQPQPYGGHVWVNPIAGYFASANFMDYTVDVTKAYVICVK